MLMQRMTPRFDAMRPTLYPPYRDRAAWQALPGAARWQAAGQAALRDAAADGTLTEARIDESVLRILTLKAKAGLLG